MHSTTTVESTTVTCPNCGKSLATKSTLPRGAKVRCKGCDRSLEPVTSQEWSGLALAGGRYNVTAKLGEGGMGFVYRALDHNIDSDVVIKVPRQAIMDDPEFVGRFTREIRSLVKLSHPHIVKVTDVGNYDGIPFAVMQYLAGGSLEDQRPVASSGQMLPCDPRSISRWLLAVAEALDYIHTQGFVHRDVKPGNILFDTQGHAFLSDFGVAKVLASAKNPAPSQTAMTGAGMVLGTPEYMAPELIMGDQFDGRVDQYALAITVYELLCGRRPFEDETKTRVLVLHTSQAPSPLTAWCPTFPPRLSQAVLKGLAKEPSQRYPNCVALARAVAAVAENTGGQKERIRLKCSTCGKTGSIPAADLDRLRAGGGRAACPACKSPIDIGNAVQVAPASSTGGTMAFSNPAGRTGEYGLAPEQSPASSGGHARHTPPAGRSGTMVMSTSDRHTPPPVPGQVSSPPGPGSGTIIERTLPRGENTETFRDLFNPLDSAGTQGAGAKVRPKSGADQTRIWIAIGAAIAAGLLATAATAFFFLSGSKHDGGSPSSTRTANAGPQPPTKNHLSQISPKEAEDLLRLDAAPAPPTRPVEVGKVAGSGAAPEPPGSSHVVPEDRPEAGFTPLFNGRDLTHWRDDGQGHWTVADGVLHHDGRGDSLRTQKDYGDVELYVDWKICPGADSGINLRGKPQVQIWDRPEGSGGLYNNKVHPNRPLVRADRPVGKWNTFHIIIRGDQVTVDLNGQRVVDCVTMENGPEYKEPLPAVGPFMLQHYYGPIQFRNIYLRELGLDAGGTAGRDEARPTSRLSPEVGRQPVAPRVVGRWSHTVNDQAPEDLRLLSDGRIASRFAGGRWTLDGTTLTLTWPRQGGAPKVNTVRLSDDGTTYQGKNDRDWVVKGVKIPDQPRGGADPVVGRWQTDRGALAVPSVWEFRGDGSLVFERYGKKAFGRWSRQGDRIVARTTSDDPRLSIQKWFTVASQGRGYMDVVMEGTRPYTWKRLDLPLEERP